jgi:hypothetical protein
MVLDNFRTLLLEWPQVRIIGIDTAGIDTVCKRNNGLIDGFIIPERVIDNGVPEEVNSWRRVSWYSNTFMTIALEERSRHQCHVPNWGVAPLKRKENPASLPGASPSNIRLLLAPHQGV